MRPSLAHDLKVLSFLPHNSTRLETGIVMPASRPILRKVGSIILDVKLLAFNRPFVIDHLIAEAFALAIATVHEHHTWFREV